MSESERICNGRLALPSSGEPLDTGDGGTANGTGGRKLRQSPLAGPEMPPTTAGGILPDFVIEHCWHILTERERIQPVCYATEAEALAVGGRPRYVVKMVRSECERILGLEIKIRERIGEATERALITEDWSGELAALREWCDDEGLLVDYGLTYQLLDEMMRQTGWREVR